MYYVYILKSLSTNRHYIGSTKDLIDRLRRHNEGRSLSTKKARPWQLICKEEFKSRREAVVREKQIKSYHGGDAFRKLIVSNRTSSGGVA